MVETFMPARWNRPWTATLIPALLFNSIALAQVKRAWVDPPPDLSASQGTIRDVSPSRDVQALPQPTSSPVPQAEPRLSGKAAQQELKDQSIDRTSSLSVKPYSVRLHQDTPTSRTSQSHQENVAAPTLPPYKTVQRNSPKDRGGTQEHDARVLAERYLELWSASNDQTLEATPTFYGSQVMFHGRSMSFAALLAEKRRFVRRWPDRTYRYQPGAMAIKCEANSNSCIVRSTFEFDAANAKLGRRSRGVGTHELVVNFTGDRLVIVSENSRVLEREGRR
jgi:hypothetical protein